MINIDSLMNIGNIDEVGLVEKEFFNQGYIYKNYENFKNKQGICYISEYQTDVIDCNCIEGEDYETYNSMLDKVNNAYDYYKIDETKISKNCVLDMVFEMLDWQSFDTLLDEYIENLDEDCFMKGDDE